jgi:hypothetical protein
MPNNRYESLNHPVSDGKEKLDGVTHLIEHPAQMAAPSMFYYMYSDPCIIRSLQGEITCLIKPHVLVTKPIFPHVNEPVI